jgi:hypothetical protein
MGIVVSNAWLDVEYGYELQKFFLSRFKIIAVVESRCEAWFEDVAINTVFVILERCDSAEERDAHLAKFVKLKKPFAELFPQDLANDAARRWSHVQELVDLIEGIGLGDSPSARPGAHKSFGRIDAPHVKQPPIDSYEDNHVRVRSIPQADLLQAVEAAGSTVKWGLYLRAPDVYFEILQTCAEKLVPFGELAEVRFGIKTGINEFFYLTPEKAKHWGIEKSFLRPVVDTTKDITSLIVRRKDLKRFLFVCNQPKSKLGGTNALRYIRWGEKQTTPSGVPWPKVPSVAGRQWWYQVPENLVADFLVLRFRDERHYTPGNPSSFAVGDTVFVGAFREGPTAAVGLALLNSFVSFLSAEVIGRTNLGDGLLTTYGPEIEQMLLPSPHIFMKDRALLRAFAPLLRRKVKPIPREATSRDRKRFEQLILGALGFDAARYGDLAGALCKLMQERLGLAQMRRKQSKARETRDIGHLIQTVVDAVLASGVRRFPEAFLRGKPDLEELGVPKEPLRIGARGIAVCELILPDGTHFDETTLERAKAICFAQRTHPDSLVVRIPTQDVVLVKALKDYSTYVRDVEQRLFREFMAKSGDSYLSENLTRKVLADYGLDMSD